MDNLLESFLTASFIFYCLGIAAITFVLRKLIEYYILDNPKLPGSKSSAFWTELFLPIAPVVNGLVFSLFIKQYPYPDGISSIYARMFFGLTAGLLSTLIYRVIKGMLKAKITITTDNTNNSDGYSIVDDTKN